ncbi:C40 family peptidase [Promicromonospora panici]|uniref:C40 family peptidase n=1 Tax=Promicromonospora panici TaxID=2219658 RepID=UPI00101C0A13|nr:NlpC/P60 family protein [Promicromonospora panici]
MTVLTDRTHEWADDQANRPTYRGRHRADGPALTPFTALSQTAAENAARTGAIAVVTSGMLASVFAQTAHTAPAETHTQATLANATPVSNTVSNTVDSKTRAGFAENLVTKVKVTQNAEFWAERGRVAVTPYAETEEGIAEAKAKAEAEARAKAEAEAKARAEAEAAAAAEAAAQAAAEAEAAAEVEATAAVEEVSAEASDLGQQAVNLALEYVGVPYVWGGASPSGFDCSGLIQYVYGQLGLDLPHSSSALSTSGYQVSAADAQPGDIVWTPGHVSLYAGNGMVVEASQEGVPVRYTEMWQSNPVYVRVTG